MSWGKKFVAVAFLLLAYCLAQASWGQEPWEKKSYKQWTMKDVVQILNGSPWAQMQTEFESLNYGLPDNSYTAVLRLRSALPIRQAVVRQRMLAVNYDRLSDSDKARFDSEVKEFLECRECDKYYILTLDSPIVSSDPKMVKIDVVWTLKDLSLAELKDNVFLATDKGERRNLVQFVPPKREGAGAMFVFERFDAQGKPLLSTADKSFYFKIDEKVFNKRSIPLRKFTFDVSRLIRNGEVIF